MKIIEIKALAIPDVKVIRYARFRDERGYFTETYRKNDFDAHPDMGFMKNIVFTQCNEAFSKAGTLRGLHFQWNPVMGKMIRVVKGRLLDYALDIRKGSPTQGKIVGYELTADDEAEFVEWIWLPAGMAHGAVIPQDSLIEYFCTGQWSPGNEAAISPMAEDIDWSLCDKKLEKEYKDIVSKTKLMTQKDIDGFSVSSWNKDPRSNKFIYNKIS